MITNWYKENEVAEMEVRVSLPVPKHKIREIAYRCHTSDDQFQRLGFYCVRIKDEIVEWCHANNISEPMFIDSGWKLMFVTKENAAAFRLKWL